MPSNWYCFTDEEHGPFPFKELTARAARGELLPSDLVRPEDKEDWERVDNIPGLLPVPQPQPEAFFSPRDQFPVQPCSDLFPVKRALCPDRHRIVRGGIFLVLQLCLLEAYWQLRSPRVVASVMPDLELQIEAGEGLLQASPMGTTRFSQRPSELEPGASADDVTFSSDRLCAVYSQYSDGEGFEDLFLAERPHLLSDFSPPRPLRAVNSTARESNPTLSPDGLELIFARAGELSLFQSHRVDRMSEFESPHPLCIAGVPAALDRQESAQFIDQLTLQFTAFDSRRGRPMRHLARREDPTAPWHYSQPVANTGVRSCRIILTESNSKRSATSPADHPSVLSPPGQGSECSLSGSGER
ncbi:DUF4339 domain-containing protein [Planctomicrobium sp. SH664]|uniref:DUF4339 domain-containing protein n=1 Tax=Planctomicrobium sp. SH664 TaxID=3448125 RepID=UPI003F5B6721